MIRPLTSAELPSLVPMCEQFYAEAKMPTRFEGSAFIGSWTVFMETGSGMIHGLFDGDELVGMIGGILFPDLYDGRLVAVEAFWFVKENNRGHGVKLLYVFEKWADKNGAKRMIVSHQARLMPEKLKEFYLRRGYRELETNFCKEVV